MIRISVIIRFKNEAEYLEPVLAAVRAQTLPGATIRIIGIDNLSTDDSKSIAQRYCDDVLSISNYYPGAAINLAMREFACDFAAMLSAHTIPADTLWLAKLLREAQKPDTLGVYGAQIYPFYSEFLDKRDLSIFSTPTTRIETRDSDLWNANSMILRQSWEDAPFDETVFELEDHYWTKCQLDGTNCVRFVPDATVYHYSHVERNDRHLPAQLVDSPNEQIADALEVLADPRASWPSLMTAVLIVKTLRAEPVTTAAIPSLIRLLGEHWDFDVRWRVADTLGAMPCAEGIDALITALADPSYYARNEAAWALARIGPNAAGRLIDRLYTVPRREWPLAAVALGRCGHSEAGSHALELLEAGLEETVGELRRAYVFASGELAALRGTTGFSRTLAALESSADEETRAAAVWAIGKLAAIEGNAADWRQCIAGFVDDASELVRAEAAVAMGRLADSRGDASIASEINRFVADPSGRVRYSATQMLVALARQGLQSNGPGPAEDDDDFGVRFETGLLRRTAADAGVVYETRRTGSQ